MRRRLGNWMPWIGLSGATALGLGATLALANAAGWLPNPPGLSNSAADVESAATMGAPADSLVWSLALQSPETRAESLKAIAAQPVSDEQVRARYLLAQDLLAQGRGGAAIPLLETLPEDFPELAVHSRIQLGKAQKASGDTAIATETWQNVLQEHGEHPASGEALYQLG
jgi:TolA-binding protein